MSIEQLDNFKQILGDRYGLNFDPRTYKTLKKAIAKRMEALGFKSDLDYHSFLQKSTGVAEEFDELISLLTVGHTNYFRSPDHFRALREYVLPRITSQKDKDKRISIWSAGCSTGDEPYSIAITLLESLKGIKQWNIKILATDINTQFLQHARSGIYDSWTTRYVARDLFDKYFKKTENTALLKEQVKDMVKFFYLNLATDGYSFVQEGIDKFDIIFCRNVLIYFRKDMVKRIVRKFYDLLGDNGYLFLGYSENLSQFSRDFEPNSLYGVFFYEKIPPELRTKPDLPVRVRTQTGRVPPAKPREIPPPSRIKPKETVTPEPQERVAPEPQEIDEKRLYLEGINHFSEERFEKAAEIFEHILEKNPRSARALLGIGFLLANKGRDSEARQKSQEVLEIDQLIPEAHYLLGILNEREGNLKATRESYERAIFLEKDFIMAHFNLAILYKREGKWREAQREFKNIVNILKTRKDNESIKFSGGFNKRSFLKICEEAVRSK
jgi:chemotaxis protein methyltransferase CheR